MPPARRFPHRHLLDVDSLSLDDIEQILDEAERWLAFNREVRPREHPLAGLTQVNLFFESSTRTLISFELAGRRLGADVVTVPIASSSVRKGETLLDTVRTVDAMAVDVMVLRHSDDGAAAAVAEAVSCSVINAGDGTNQHPTQALLDALTIRRRLGRIEGLKIAICGDIRHSRVANSGRRLLARLGAEVRLVAPPGLQPDEAGDAAIFSDMDEGMKGADVVMMLRIQRERMEDALTGLLGDFHSAYGLTAARLDRTAPNAMVMHPGPINRGIEIESALADDPRRSLILDQVESGVAVRMACLDLLTRERRALV
jgi:aspartate carbamoyltransferase catalytic subunit